MWLQAGLLTGVKRQMSNMSVSHKRSKRLAMTERFRYSLLRSPETLGKSFLTQELDMTDTVEDVKLMSGWLTSISKSIERKREVLFKKDLCCFNFSDLLQKALRGSYIILRHHEPRQGKGMFLWYYTGHGLGKDTADRLEYSSTPYFFSIHHGPITLFQDANDFVKENRKVKGGELCLHEHGFCDLYGLLKLWIAAVKPKGADEKKDKHLVIVLDSCHSGIPAEDLKDFVENMRKKGDSLLNDNSVTIQAACGPNESTFGGYFTPCFVYLNDPKNKKLLNELKKKWEKMKDEEKNKYRCIELPSPMVVTTRTSPQSAAVDTQSQGATMELNVANFKLTLFPDAGFFKFCSIKVFQHQQAAGLKSAKERALTLSTADAFIKSGTFTVLDYKLKSYQGKGPTDPNAGSPMGLFLLDDPPNPGFAVCAHVHFKPGSSDVDDVQRINLVHHKTPPLSSTLYVQDGGKVMVQMTTAAEITDAIKLVEACRHFVESNEPGRWYDLSRWNMAGNQIGVNKLIRLKERSAWEESYLKYIEQFNLPKASG